MKKIIILIIFIIIGISQGYSCIFDCHYTAPITESRELNGTNCRYHNSDFCTKNYLYGNEIYSNNIENTTKIFNVGKIWVSKYDFDFNYEEDLTYSFGGGSATDNINKISYKISEKKNRITVDKYLTIPKLYETKYNNHAIYYVYPYIKEGIYKDEKIKEINLELYKKYSDKIGLYIDDKRIGEYVLDGENDYKNIDDFFVENKIMAFDNKDEYLFKKTDYILKEKTLKKLDDFVEKVEKINYDKEKLLKKIDIIYNEYKEKSGSKNKFISEVFLYLHTEILINKLKQNEELKTLKF
ncbi:MAG: hypothetical protein Q9M94_05640 [Candidatus Gracilibacteria bacterium]|nr:hypothetical protein [Candidatus Gracilibacteria bacterium]MDQ7022079.1 hypothetical protein [Candidatus Gracilibacteria bacterium]